MVSGTHTYADSGTFTVQVTITDPADNTLTLTATATVSSSSFTGGTLSPVLVFGDAAPWGVGTTPDAIASADFNNDGNADLVVANYGIATVSVLLGNGTDHGTFQAPVQYAVGAGPDAVVTGDFNGDGNLDVALANFLDNTVSVLLGNGDGTFQNAVTYDVGDGPTGLVAGDFNNDGILDLATVNQNDGTVSVLLGNGDGTFQNAVTSVDGTSGGSALVAADFDGDGNLDLATANAANNTASVLLGNGDGTFQAPVNYNVGRQPVALATFMASDGTPELATANYGDNTVSVLVNNGDGTFQPALDRCRGGATRLAGRRRHRQRRRGRPGRGQLRRQYLHGVDRQRRRHSVSRGGLQPDAWSRGRWGDAGGLQQRRQPGHRRGLPEWGGGGLQLQLSPTGLENQPISGTLAVFTDSNPDATASDFTCARPNCHRTRSQIKTVRILVSQGPVSRIPENFGEPQCDGVGRSVAFRGGRTEASVQRLRRWRPNDTSRADRMRRRWDLHRACCRLGR